MAWIMRLGAFTSTRDHGNVGRLPAAPDTLGLNSSPLALAWRTLSVGPRVDSALIRSASTRRLMTLAPSGRTFAIARRSGPGWSSEPPVGGVAGFARVGVGVGVVIVTSGTVIAGTVNA